MEYSYRILKQICEKILMVTDQGREGGGGISTFLFLPCFFKERKHNVVTITYVCHKSEKDSLHAIGAFEDICVCPFFKIKIKVEFYFENSFSLEK